MRSKATPLIVINNIIRVAKRGALPIPIVDDITTDQQLHDLLRSSLTPDDQELCHFGLTPSDKIPQG